MLGREPILGQNLTTPGAAIDQQLAAYETLAKRVASATPERTSTFALKPFESMFFNNMTLVLDRYFVHRLRRSGARTPIRSTKSKSCATP
jgi:hypothetical protein